jgi:prepilin-type N-terminal cleavage/methylation domain-containing protein
MGRKNGFTLIEIMVSLAVFAVVMAVMASAFFKISKDWQRQREYNLVLENGRWAMEFISNSIRSGHSDDNVSVTGENPLNDHELLKFLADTTHTHGKGKPQDKKIYFWRGKPTVGPGQRDYVLYYSPANWNRDLNWTVNHDAPQEVCRFVVAGTDIFNVSAGCAAAEPNCTVEINLTVRPRPDQPVAPGNQNYTFRTLVRPRN